MSNTQELINKLIQKVEAVENFTLEQAPDICKEIVETRKVELHDLIYVNLFFMVLAIPVLAGSVFLGVSVNLSETLSSDSVAGLTVLSFVLGVLSLLFFISTMWESIQCVLNLRILNAGSKLYILENLTKIAHGRK